MQQADKSLLLPSPQPLWEIVLHTACPDAPHIAEQTYLSALTRNATLCITFHLLPGSHFLSPTVIFSHTWSMEVFWLSEIIKFMKVFYKLLTTMQREGIFIAVIFVAFRNTWGYTEIHFIK